MKKSNHLFTSILFAGAAIVSSPSFWQNTQKILTNTQNEILQTIPADISSYPIDWIIRHYKESAENIIKENILKQTNALRQINSCKLLQLDPYLDQTAHTHAIELFERYGTNNPKSLDDYHVWNDGSDPTTRANKESSKYVFVVENVWFNYYSIDDAMSHRINSDSHLVNITDSESSDIWIAYYKGYRVVLFGAKKTK